MRKDHVRPPDRLLPLSTPHCYTTPLPTRPTTTGSTSHPSPLSRTPPLTWPPYFLHIACVSPIASLWQGPLCDSIILWAKRGRVQQVRAGGIVVVLFCAALLLSNRWRLLRTFNPPAGTYLAVMRCHGNACGRRVCANRWSVLVVKGAGCPSCRVTLCCMYR